MWVGKKPGRSRSIHPLGMLDPFGLLLWALRARLHSRDDLVSENLLLGNQLAVLTRRGRKRLQLRTRDKLLWVLARRSAGPGIVTSSSSGSTPSCADRAGPGRSSDLGGRAPDSCDGVRARR